ncbi:DNA polymerase III subunit beta (plasmid) [Embleya sp. NBC_00888]|uniref:DNA polymerase III subunit beta n=1 Tax=Embleya sp. NBC_00888 TaxID=2975960 RepID=UPI002F90DDE9|nr:DNA polymerase III subunit beta [Embleya sp. NBC_00888]
MKVRIPRDRLVEGIGWAVRALPARPVIPALASFRLTAADGTLTISAYDYEVSAGIEVSAEVGRPGEILVPGRLLADIARALPRDHPVELSVDPARARLTCAGSYFALPLPALADYPATPLLPETAGTVSAAGFAEAVAQVAIAAARDESLPVLTAIRLHLAHDALILAATDRYRLAVRRLPWHPATEDPARTALVPARVLADLTKHPGAGEDFRLALGPEPGRRGLLGLAGGGRHATTRLLDHEFPRYDWLFDNETTAVATIDAAALIEAVRRVSLVITRNAPVRLSFARDSLRIEAGTTDQAEARATVPVTMTGEPTRVAFNPTHLLDGLAALRTPTARLMFSAPTKPTVLTDDTHADEPERTNGSDDPNTPNTPVEPNKHAGSPNHDADTPSASEPPDYRYLLMPMRGT